MVNAELHKYLRENIQKGYSPQVLSQGLIEGGWDRNVVAQALAEIAEEDMKSQEVSTQVPQISQDMVLQNSTVLSEPAEVSTEKELGSKNTLNQSAPAYSEASLFGVADSAVPTTSKRPRLFLILAIIVFLFVGVGGVTAFFILTPKVLSPDEILMRMRDAQSSVHSYDYEGEIGMDFTGKMSGGAFQNNDTAGTLKLNTRATGSMNIIGGKATSTEMDFHYVISGNAGYGAFNVVLDGAADLRLVENIVYARVVKLPQVLSMMGADASLSKWEGTWIKIDPKATSSFSALLPTEYASTSALVSSSEDQKQLGEIAKKNWPFVLAEVKEEEAQILEGEEMYHLQYAVDRQKMKAFLTDVLAYQSKLEKGNSKKLSPEEVSMAVDVFASSTGEMFIGKKDFFLHRFTLHMPITVATSSVEITGAISLDFTFTKFNSAIRITAPADAKSLEEVYELTVGKSATPALQHAQSTSVEGGHGIVSGNSERSKIIRDAYRTNDIGVIQLALLQYYDEHGQFPNSLSKLTSVYFDKYFSRTPTDPSDGKSYSYGSMDGGTSYALGASLEMSDNQILKSDADQKTTAFSTDDRKGCKGEVGRYCYDLKP